MSAPRFIEIDGKRYQVKRFVLSGAEIRGFRYLDSWFQVPGVKKSRSRAGAYGDSSRA